LLVAAVVALLLGIGIGYGIGTGHAATPQPTLAAVSDQASASPTPMPSARGFIANPCRLLSRLPIMPPSSDQIANARLDPSALPGMVDCTYLDASGRVVATLSLRQAPTTRRELAVTVDEVFQGEGVNEASIGSLEAYAIPCAHAWTPCRPAVAVIREPHFLVVTLGPGQGDLDIASALAEDVLLALPT
jgi:hypothetical protein